MAESGEDWFVLDVLGWAQGGNHLADPHLKGSAPLQADGEFLGALGRRFWTRGWTMPGSLQ
ncbi:hypothetical protein [Thiohalorhabdus methylotrophus]|uniref:Uncharacterized protein n=1 Tax=Thiohalorhabdus methylotrophus TaxID=3242694 RepID=A0ABV4TTY4_9GAMM